MEGGGIHVRAPSVAIDFNIDPIFNTGCFIQYEVNTEPFSLDPSGWKVQNTQGNLKRYLFHRHHYGINMQANVTFMNNTAGTDGAAIYATSIDRCKHVPIYETTINSIFNVTPPFIFRYIYTLLFYIYIMSTSHHMLFSVGIQ